MVFFLSFCKFSTVTDWKWVGFKNYTRIFVVNGSVDTTFIHSIWYTALFTVVSVLIINIVSFAIAMALTKGIRGTNLFRTVFFLPNLIGGIILGYVWQLLLNGLLLQINKTLTLFFCLRILGPCDPDVLAADRIYDDHLCGRSE